MYHESTAALIFHSHNQPELDNIRTNQHEFGGCITRGAFYTGTAFPTAYRNNFFFCDYNSGKVMRSVNGLT